MRKFFLLLLIAALMIPFAAPAEGNGVITSGDSSYKLDQLSKRESGLYRRYTEDR